MDLFTNFIFSCFHRKAPDLEGRLTSICKEVLTDLSETFKKFLRNEQSIWVFDYILLFFLLKCNIPVSATPTISGNKIWMGHISTKTCKTIFQHMHTIHPIILFHIFMLFFKWNWVLFEIYEILNLLKSFFYHFWNGTSKR